MFRILCCKLYGMTINWPFKEGLDNRTDSQNYNTDSTLDLWTSGLKKQS